jgi:hypothetical protein
MDESSAVQVADVDELETLVDLDDMAATAFMPDGLMEDELDKLSNLDARLVPGLVTNAYEFSDDEERDVPRYDNSHDTDFE